MGMVFLGLYSAFLFLQTRRVELMPNSSILVSSDHITFSQASSGSSRCSLANFRLAYICAFFSRGTLRAQQDLNPSRCSVLLMVLFVTVVPIAFRSLTSSSCVVLGWSLTFLIIIDIPRGEILCGAPVRGRLAVTLCFFHFLTIAPTVVNFSPSCLLIFLYPSLVQVYNFVPDVLRQLPCLAHGGNVGMWLIVWTGDFYTAT